MERCTARHLIDRYDVFFLDIYGVLVRTDGPIPGAADFLSAIRAAGKRFFLLSNDASRSLESSFARYGGFGLPIERAQIITSGMLLTDYFARNNLRGRPTIVLGSSDSAGYVRDAGGVVVAHDDDSAEIVVCADDDGFPFLSTINKVVTVLFRRLERGLPTQLILPNPDLVFPVRKDSYGVTAGAMAALIETVLNLREGGAGLRFVPLGKPYAPIFEAGMLRVPGVSKARIVMIGDQVVTDIRGARDFGLHAAFMETGVGRIADAQRFDVHPDWVLADLKP